MTKTSVVPTLLLPPLWWLLLLFVGVGSATGSQGLYFVHSFLSKATKVSRLAAWQGRVLGFPEIHYRLVLLQETSLPFFCASVSTSFWGGGEGSLNPVVP